MEEQKGIPQTTRNPETGELEIGKSESEDNNSLTSNIDNEENKKES